MDDLEHPIEPDSVRFYAQKLVDLTQGHDRMLALELRNRINTPMASVLERVKGATINEKAKRAKVSRQTWYTWIREEARPNVRQAKVLAKLTGFSVEEIHGRRP